MSIRRILPMALVALVLALAGCGGGSADPASGPSGHAQDVAFAGATLRLHAESLTLVDLTLGRPVPPEVSTLAEEVRAEQTGQVEALADLLTGWGEEVPETMRDHLNAEEKGGAELTGVLDPQRLEELERASDAEFAGLWLAAMSDVHRAIVEAARTEIDRGTDPDALALARTIRKGHEDRLTRMSASAGAG